MTSLRPRRFAALIVVASCAALPVATANATPTSTWAINAGGISGDSDRASSGTPLPDGGTLSTGYYYRTIAFGSTSLTTAGGYDVFVAKAAANGTWEWAASAGGTGSEEPYTVTSFADGTSMVTGYFDGTIHFGGSISLTAAGSSDVFVAKLNADGTWAWAVRGGGTGGDTGIGVTRLTGGGAIVTGTFAGTATFGSTSLTSAGGDDGFVAKLNADGTWGWATRAGGTGADAINRSSTSSDGSAVVVGTFNSSATFPGAGTVSAAGGTGEDMVVAKINADGTWAWATSAGGTSADRGTGIAVLADGSALASAWMSSASPVFGTTTLTGLGSWDAVAAKISPTGTWQWAANGGGAADDRALAITAFSDGSALISGPFNGTASFGLISITSAGGQDVFAASLTPSGSWDWAVRGGGVSNDSPFGVAAFPDGSAAVVGAFSSTGPSFGGLAPLTRLGSGDAFTWRLTGAGATGTPSNGPDGFAGPAADPAPSGGSSPAPVEPGAAAPTESPARAGGFVPPVPVPTSGVARGDIRGSVVMATGTAVTARQVLRVAGIAAAARASVTFGRIQDPSLTIRNGRLVATVAGTYTVNIVVRSKHGRARVRKIKMYVGSA